MTGCRGARRYPDACIASWDVRHRSVGRGRRTQETGILVAGVRHEGEEFAVVGKDGSVHLPDDVVADWPPGTQVVVERDGDEVRLRRRQR